MNRSVSALGLSLGVLLAVVARPAASAPTRDPSSGPIAVKVDASGLNVRSAPSTSSQIYGVAPDNAVYAATAESNGWYKVWFSGRAAWMKGTYLDDASNGLVTITASALNVRTGPGTGYNAFGTVFAGQTYAATSTAGGWTKIWFDNREGWVSSGYVRSNGGGTVPTTPTKPQPSGTHPTSSRGFIQLAPSGQGFYCYSPSNRRWGTTRMVLGIERVARRWSSERPSGTTARMGIGDISYANGGPISGHASHQKGVDADFRLPRNDGREESTTRFLSSYSRSGTQKLVNLFRAELNVQYVFFNDPRVTGVSKWPNHDNHFHVRVY